MSTVFCHPYASHHIRSVSSVRARLYVRWVNIGRNRHTTGIFYYNGYILCAIFNVASVEIYHIFVAVRHFVAHLYFSMCFFVSYLLHLCLSSTARINSSTHSSPHQAGSLRDLHHYLHDNFILHGTKKNRAYI